MLLNVEIRMLALLVILHQLSTCHTHHTQFNPHNFYIRRDSCKTSTGQPGHCMLEQYCPTFAVVGTGTRAASSTLSYCKISVGIGRPSGAPKICCPNSSEAIRESVPTNSKTASLIMPASQSRPYSPTSEQKVDYRHRNLHLLPVPCGLAPMISAPSGHGNVSPEMGVGVGKVLRRKKRAPEHIIGGKDAVLGSHPWMALLGYVDADETDREIQYGCGGTLINSRYILTAAHCLPNFRNVNLRAFKLSKVKVGEHDQNQDTDCSTNQKNRICSKVQIIDVEQVILHQDYNSTGREENDIALIRLQKPVQFGSFVAPICLPLFKSDQNHCNQVVSAVKFTIAGWGRRNPSNAEGSPILQEVEIPAFTKSECNKFYASKTPGAIDDSRFCAGGEGGKDSCQGDSGGPILRKVPSKNVNFASYAVQCGIVSLGSGECGTAGSPSLYTSASYFVSWILDSMKA